MNEFLETDIKAFDKDVDVLKENEIVIRGSQTHPLKKGERILVFFNDWFTPQKPAFYKVNIKRANEVYCLKEFDVIGYPHNPISLMGDFTISWGNHLLKNLFELFHENFIEDFVATLKVPLPPHKRVNPFQWVIQDEIRRRHNRCKSNLNSNFKTIFRRQM